MFFFIKSLTPECYFSTFFVNSPLSYILKQCTHTVKLESECVVLSMLSAVEKLICSTQVLKVRRTSFHMCEDLAYKCYRHLLSPSVSGQKVTQTQL